MGHVPNCELPGGSELPQQRAQERLPPRLRRALGKELGPAERVMAILRPRGIRTGMLLREVPIGMLIWVTLPLALTLALSPGASGPNLWVGLLLFLGWASRGVAELAGCWLQRRHNAYVLTNQRSFRIASHVLSVRVTDLTALPEDADLTAEDLLALGRALEALPVSGSSLTRAEPPSRPGRPVPGWLRQRVERQLAMGETLVHLEQPSIGAHLRHAPVDLPTAVLFVAAAVALFPGLLALVASLFGLPGGQNAAGLVAGSLLPGVGMGALAFARLTNRIRSTAYAVTDRRAFVIGPDRRITTFTPRQLRQFQRVQDGAGRGNLTPAGSARGFHGLQDVKELDDLLKLRPARDRSTELLPAASPTGRGDEPAAAA